MKISANVRILFGYYGKIKKKINGKQTIYCETWVYEQ
jgi:hypothetical protein